MVEVGVGSLVLWSFFDGQEEDRFGVLLRMDQMLVRVCCIVCLEETGTVLCCRDRMRQGMCAGLRWSPSLRAVNRDGLES